MTARECESGRKEEAMRGSAPSGESEVCGLCSSALPAKPEIVYVRDLDGRLEELRLCPLCFLKIVAGVRA